MSPNPPSSRTARIGDRFVDFIVRHPWRAMLIAVLVVGALLPGGQHIQADFTYRVWFHDDDPLIVEFDGFERRFGNDEAAMMVIHSPSGIFDKESAQLLIELTERMWQVIDVIRVTSLANHNWVHAEEDDLVVEPLIPDDLELTDELLAERKAVALNDESLPGWLVSKDGNTALLYAHLKPSLDEFTDYDKVVNAVYAAVAEFEGRGDHTFYQTGSPAISYAFKDATTKDFQRLLPIVLLLTMLFLAILFRRISGVLLPFVVIILSIMSTMTTAGWLGIKINNMTSIVPQILVAVSVADAVHVLVSFFSAMRSGLDRREAARHSLRKNLQPTILTSISTTIGFMSFSTAEVVPIAHMGILAGIGTLYAWFITYFMVGPLMVLLPIRQGKVAEGARLDRPTPRALMLAGRIAGVRVPVISAFILLTAAALMYARGSEVNSDPFDYFPDGAALNVATDFLNEHVGGGLASELVIEAGKEEGIKDPAFLERVDALEQWLEQRPFVTSANSILDVLKSTNRSLYGGDQEHYVLPDSQRGVAEQLLLYTMGLPQGMDINDRVTLSNDALRITSMWTITDSNTVLKEIAGIEAKAASMGLDAFVTGKAQLWQNMNPYVVRSFTVSVTIAVILMSLLLIVALRSAGLGLLAMIPNFVPLILGAAFLRLLGKPLDIGTIIVFSVCLGIAVDDTVHFLANYNRLRGEGASAREAVARIFTHTIPALFTTTVVLVVAFGVFAFANFIPNRFFGILVAFILSAALFTDITLLPALLLGKDGSDEATAKGAAPSAPDAA